jgi:two-component system chemotaxis response regulator CheB
MSTALKPPRIADQLVVIGGSAGAIGPLCAILAELPPSLPAAVVVVQHSDPTRPSLLAPIIARRSKLIVGVATDGEPLHAGHVYVIPPDRHARVSVDHHLHLADGTRIRRVRSSANPLFETAASAFQARAIAVVLSGTGFDATDGVQAIKRHGGTVIVESLDTAQHTGMPGSAISTGVVDFQLPAEGIAAAIKRIVEGKSRPRAAIDSTGV